MARKTKKPEYGSAYTAAGRLVCPFCFSRPDIEGRQRLEWGITLLDTHTNADGSSGRVAETMYPCANADCRTVIPARFLLGVTGKASTAPFAPALTLSPERQAHYDRGKTGKDGVWREQGVPLVVAPPPDHEDFVATRKEGHKSVKKVVAKRKKAPATKLAKKATPKGKVPRKKGR